MIGRGCFFASLVAVCALLACACTPLVHRNPSGKPDTLILVSIDGFRANYLDRGLTPTLSALAADGVRADALRPSFPWLTFPNHYSIVTGRYPDHHGIIHNTMTDAKLGTFSLSNRKAVQDGRWWEEGKPVWVSADEQGLKTATMYWPGSEARIDGHRPDHWLPFDSRTTPAQRVDKVLAWLDLPPRERPSFVTLYFDSVDHDGHRFGPDSPQVDAALRDVDAALARLVEGLRARNRFRDTNLIVLSDHGMAASSAGQVVLLDKLVDIDDVSLVAMGVLAELDPKPQQEAQVETALLRPHPHMRCWRKAGIPARFHYGSNARIPSIVCLANTGWQIATSEYLAKRKTPLSLGQHGYDDADPLMRALFVAHGPAFKRGMRVAEFPNVDVYPLMTRLLGIPAAPNDGDFDAVKGMLRSVATDPGHDREPR